MGDLFAFLTAAVLLPAKVTGHIVLQNRTADGDVVRLELWRSDLKLLSGVERPHP